MLDKDWCWDEKQTCLWQMSTFEKIDWCIPECRQHEALIYDDYGIKGKDFKYCPYCGLEIKVIKAGKR